MEYVDICDQIDFLRLRCTLLRENIRRYEQLAAKTKNINGARLEYIRLLKQARENYAVVNLRLGELLELKADWVETNL